MLMRNLESSLSLSLILGANDRYALTAVRRIRQKLEGFDPDKLEDGVRTRIEAAEDDLIHITFLLSLFSDGEHSRTSRADNQSSR